MSAGVAYADPVARDQVAHDRIHPSGRAEPRLDLVSHRLDRARASAPASDDGQLSWRRRFNIIIGDRETVPAPEIRLVSDKLLLAVKLAAICAVMGGIYYGPPYYVCRQMKERGMFYSGTTVGSCVNERLEARNDQVEQLSRQLPMLLGRRGA